MDTIERATHALSDEQARAVDALLFPRALELSPGQLCRFVRRLVVNVDPEGAAARAEVRRQQRQVSMQHDEDGMSWLTAYLPSEDALACWDRVNRLAYEAKDADCGIDQVRADVVRDLLLGKGGGNTVAHVYVTVDAETLFGLAERAGEVRGYGPLPADRVREPGSGASWRS